jgi:uncharacterized cupredoxin-like copper-binding protein
VRFATLRLPLLVSLGVPVLALGAGCAGHQSSATSHGQSIAVTERDFRIAVRGSTRRVHIASGDVRLSVGNRGPDTHELLVVRMRGSQLPLRTDGLTVDEDAVEKATVGTLDGGERGSTRQLRLHLTPGRYVLFCNMAGHYLGGMHTDVVVR